MSASTPEDRIAALEAALRVKTAPAPKLSPFGERVVASMNRAARFSPGVAILAGFGWACLLALAWQWVTG